MSNLGFLAFSSSYFSCISWKSLSWKSIYVETYFIESRKNNSYTQLFSGSLLLILQLPLWLVGRPWYVRDPNKVVPLELRRFPLYSYMIYT